MRLITRDPFGHFTRVCLRERPRRITIISPWLTDADVRPTTLSRLVVHAERHGAAIVVVSRLPRSEMHQDAIDLVQATSRSRVRFNPRLHGKLYVCETGGGRGFAVIGSANGTDSSAHLDEIALLVRPDRGSRLIAELATKGVRALSGTRRARTRTSAATSV